MTARAERAAQRAVAAGVRVEQAWAAVRAALPLFTPTGELNSRSRAEGLIAAALPALEGPEWSKTRRALGRPELLTFLDQVHGRLAALPVPAAVRDAVVQAEGLRQRPEALSGAGPSAALRGVLVVTGALLAGLGEAGASAVASVRSVLGTAWRASSLVECLNSVARMQQSRHRRMTAGLLDLKRLYWNCRVFRTGRRRDRTPYGMLGVRLPTTDWWELLNLPPELLRQQLSAPGVAA